MSKLTKALTAAAGNAGGDPLYAEDVFSTYLYTGTGSAMTITNGVNLEDNGGIVWTKPRTSSGESHRLIDADNSTILASDLTNSKLNGSLSVPQYYLQNNTDGFDLVGNVSVLSGTDYASWTFRKAEKFFDVVTWTGNSTAGRTVAHNLGSAPKFVIVKRTDTANNWVCWHSGIAITKYLQLNSSNQALNDGGIFWDSTLPDASNITLGSDSGVNATGSTYVAYLFASDAGGFGDDGSESIIKCGSYTGNGTTAPVEVNCGFEPQFVLIKGTTSGMSNGNWSIVDTMRGFPANTTATLGGSVPVLYPNASSGDDVSAGYWGWLTSTGFSMYESNVSGSGINYIYIAIRRPMKTPESGTEVFAMDTLGSTGDGNQPGYRSPFPVDMGLKTSLTGNQRQISTRLLQGTELLTESTAAEAASASKQFDYMNGTDTSTATSSVNMMWMLKRATGFMDAVAYSGTGTNPTNFSHNLNVVPELMIFKKRSASDRWEIYSAALGNSKRIDLNTNGAATTNTSIWGGTPTATQFSLTDNPNVNQTGQTYISYLFATLAGVSKVGSYTGTGADLNVDCGFSAGARFILIKRTDATGDWYVWDSVRGITAGNDPYLLLNTTAAQVTNTDYIDPLSSGFTVTSSASSTVNVSSGNYIFLAIA